MEKSNKKFYILNWFWNITKHGLIFHGLRNRFAKIGLDFMPYYWVEEEVTPCNDIAIDPALNNIEITEFTEYDLKYVKSRIIGIDHKDLMGFLAQGQRCIGLKVEHQIAAYMFISLKSVVFRSQNLTIKNGQAYLHSMYVFEEYRGQKLAPFLRYQVYRLIEKEGIKQKFSVSEYFNTSTIKFKQKLNAKHLMLYLDINIFNIFKKCFLIKTYKQSSNDHETNPAIR